VRPAGLGKLKKLIHIIGYRTRDLPACSTANYNIFSERPVFLIDFKKFWEELSAFFPLIEHDQMEKNEYRMTGFLDFAHRPEF
jgi:hypothetical protein